MSLGAEVDNGVGHGVHNVVFGCVFSETTALLHQNRFLAELLAIRQRGSSQGLVQRNIDNGHAADKLDSWPPSD